MTQAQLSQLDQTVQNFRTALLRRDAAPQVLLMRSYDLTLRRLTSNISALAEAIESVRRDGGISDGVLARKLRAVNVQQIRNETYSDALARVLTRQRQLLEQAAEEMQRLAVGTGVRLEAAQSAAIELGLLHSSELLAMALPPEMTFTRLPKGALQEITAALSPGSPVAEILARTGEKAATALHEALIAGVATGQGPRAIAAGMRQALGTQAFNLMTLTRTEVLRAYRSASLETYRANSDVVRKWRWTCARSVRTCGLCWAMDGQEFDLDEPFSSHPCCRCSPIPVTVSWKDLGFDIPEPHVHLETGAEAFAQLTPEEQLKVLGPSKLRLYNAGQLTLRDLVASTQSAVWGPGRRERTLREVMG